jgi:DUF438 domain-containing protein
MKIRSDIFPIVKKEFSYEQNPLSGLKYGIKVQNCHPPQSLEAVENILKSFKEGKRDTVDFWINVEGKFVYIRYFAVRDEGGSYLGTLEVSQDLTEIKKLKGEKRLDAETY